MQIKTKFLKFFYNALLTGMPSLMNNPFNKNVLHTKFCVNEYSTYINYRLNDLQLSNIKSYLDDNTNGLEIIPSSLLKDNNNKDYFLSINIYNCTSPLFDFISEEPATRCELNIYVKDKYENEGTLIVDYASNILSLDPDNLFKSSGKINFNMKNETINGYVNDKKFCLGFYYDILSNELPYNKLSADLIKLSDRIYYKNGLYDKLYYDTSLIDNKIVDCKDYNVYFKFLGMRFEEVDSVFFFENEINFVGGLWDNLYNDEFNKAYP